jgi:hypothetical protein
MLPLCVALASVLPAGPPPLPSGQWTPLAAWTDEFDGEALDAEKWSPTGPGG